MDSYSFNSHISIIRDGIAAEQGNKALQAEFDRVYECFTNEVQTQIKQGTTPLTHDDKENLKMMFSLLLDLHTAVNE